ncbi:uncharacterized protein LOC124167029 [Ischnura elegans]|uniref:uncharacterized protein LOC124167029 n=1 Tax=Ischnura elegans TaxID=197161 RepID=UPI001ED8A68E|nr:uncharacterized protein LOC124167029 [Ischnura elegans]
MTSGFYKCFYNLNDLMTSVIEESCFELFCSEGYVTTMIIDKFRACVQARPKNYSMHSSKDNQEVIGDDTVSPNHSVATKQVEEPEYDVLLDNDKEIEDEEASEYAVKTECDVASGYAADDEYEEASEHADEDERKESLQQIKAFASEESCELEVPAAQVEESKDANEDEAAQEEVQVKHDRFVARKFPTASKYAVKLEQISEDSFEEASQETEETEQETISDYSRENEDEEANKEEVEDDRGLTRKFSEASKDTASLKQFVEDIYEEASQEIAETEQEIMSEHARQLEYEEGLRNAVICGRKEKSEQSEACACSRASECAVKLDHEEETRSEAESMPACPLHNPSEVSALSIYGGPLEGPLCGTTWSGYYRGYYLREPPVKRSIISKFLRLLCHPCNVDKRQTMNIPTLMKTKKKNNPVQYHLLVHEDPLYPDSVKNKRKNLAASQSSVKLFVFEEKIMKNV